MKARVHINHAPISYYVVYWAGDPGSMYVAGFMDPIAAVQLIEEGGFVWVAKHLLDDVRAVRAENITTVEMETNDALSSLSR